MDIKELLEYIQENLDDDCLTMQSKVYILDEWGDTNPVINITNDCNELTLSSRWADTQHTYDPDKVVQQLEEARQISASAKAEAIAGMCGASANYYKGAECAYERAIEIVRGGGVDAKANS